ncbi:MAG: ribosome maturation factor RimP [Collinsella sp.]
MVKSKVEQDIIDALEARARRARHRHRRRRGRRCHQGPLRARAPDKLEGDPINLDEVTAQTAWVSETVEALDPISSAYTLEVSSRHEAPRCAARPTSPASWARTVELTTDGRWRAAVACEGAIAAATDACVTIQPEGEDAVTIAFDDVKKCTLKPVFDFKGVKEGN